MVFWKKAPEASEPDKRMSLSDIQNKLDSEKHEEIREAKINLLKYNLNYGYEDAAVETAESGFAEDKDLEDLDDDNFKSLLRLQAEYAELLSEAPKRIGSEKKKKEGEEVFNDEELFEIANETKNRNYFSKAASLIIQKFDEYNEEEIKSHITAIETLARRAMDDPTYNPISIPLMELLQNYGNPNQKIFANEYCFYNSVSDKNKLIAAHYLKENGERDSQKEDAWKFLIPHKTELTSPLPQSKEIECLTDEQIRDAFKDTFMGQKLKYIGSITNPEGPIHNDKKAIILEVLQEKFADAPLNDPLPQHAPKNGLSEQEIKNAFKKAITEKSIEDIAALSDPQMNADKKELIKAVLQEKFSVASDLTQALPGPPASGLSEQDIKDAFRDAIAQKSVQDIAALSVLDMNADKKELIKAALQKKFVDSNFDLIHALPGPPPENGLNEQEITDAFKDAIGQKSVQEIAALSDPAMNADKKELIKAALQAKFVDANFDLTHSLPEQVENGLTNAEILKEFNDALSQKSVQEIVELNSPGLHENKKTLLQSALQEKFIVDLDLANPLPSQQENGLTDEKIREAFEKAVDQALLGNVGSLAKLIVDHALEPDKINDNKNESIDKVLRTKMAADPNAKTLAMKVFQEQGNAAQKREANQFFLKTGNPDEKLAAAKEVIKDKDNPAELEIMKLAHLQMLDSNDLSEKLTSARELREPTYKDIITSDEIIPVNLLLLKHSESPPEQQTAAKELSEHPDDANKIIAYRYLVKSNEDHTSLKAAKALRDLSSDENDNKIANSYLLNKSPNGSSDKIVAAFNLRNAEGAEGMNAKEYLNTKHFMETKLDFTIISSEDEEKDIETPQRIVSIYSANLNPEEAKALINPNMDGALQQSRIHVWSESLVATSDNTYSLEEQRQVGLAKVLAFKDQGLQRQASEREQKAEIKKIGPMIFSGTWTPTEAAIAVNFGIGTGEPIKIKLGFTIETDDHSKITYKLVNQDPQWVFETAEGNAIDRKRFLGNVKGHLFRKSPIEKLLINLETLTNNEPFSNKFSDNDKKEAGNAFYKIYTELEKSDPDMTKDLTKNFEIRYTDKKLQCLPRNKEEYPPEKVDLPHPS